MTKQQKTDELMNFISDKTNELSDEQIQRWKVLAGIEC